MDHELFGPLTYDAERSCWCGRRLLPAFAPYAVQLPPDEPHPDESAEDDEDDEPGADDPSAVEDERLRREGYFPVEIYSPERSPPTPEQEAVFRHLLEDEAEVCREVFAEVFREYQLYDDSADEESSDQLPRPRVVGPEALAAVMSVDHLEISGDHYDGFAEILFVTSCDWTFDEGVIAYHPEAGAQWVDDPYPEDDDYLEFDEEEYVQPGGLTILDALREQGVDEARRLIDAGNNINDFGDENPPLWHAVEDMNIDHVKQLLELGADPNRHKHGEKPPMRYAKKLLREFVPPNKGKRPREKYEAARAAEPERFAESRAKLEELIRVLKAAGAK